MRLGMNFLLWTVELADRHLPLFDTVRAAGFDGAELVVAAGTPDHFARLGGVARDAGLALTAITHATVETNPISPDRAVRAAAVEHLRRSIERAHALGAEVLAGPFHSAFAHFVGRGPTADERARCAEVMRAAAEEAQTAGVRLAVEFLNRFECYLLNTTADALDLCRRVDHPAFGILYDTHHAHIEERDVGAAIRSAGAAITHVHVSENDRGVPGQGQVAWAATASALREVGYDGWLVVEAFSRLDPDFAAAIHVWRDYFVDPLDCLRLGGPFLKRTFGLE